jgi:hypothetical protein
VLSAEDRAAARALELAALVRTGRAPVMYVTERVPARDIRPGDRINGFIAAEVTVGDGQTWVEWGVRGKADGYYQHTGYVTLDRPTAGMVPCPECGDPMNSKRLDERALEITNGRCSECVAYPRRHAEQVERERRVAAFGEGRC